MRKRRIAVFVNGWSNEYALTVLGGISQCAKEQNVDIFTFLDYASTEMTEEEVQGEINVFSLAHLEDFDGVLLLSNTFNTESESELLREEIIAKKIPALSLEYQFEGIDFMGTDNYSGMIELAEHLFGVHKVKSLIWVGGPRNNKESAERFNALSDVAKRFDVTIPEENMLYGHWSDYVTQRELNIWFEQHKQMPDAIVCANDYMALGACVFLEQKGYHVPQQILVTGFDHIETGQSFYPAITSVDRRWENFGYQAMQKLLKKINGDSCEQVQSRESFLAIEESCGCIADAGLRQHQRNVCRMHYTQQMKKVIFDWHLGGIDKATEHIKNKKELVSRLNHFFVEHQGYEGRNFGIYLDQNFIESFERDTRLRTIGYSDQMEVIFSMKDGVAQEPKMIQTRQIFADYDENSKESHVFLLISLHDMGRCIGYVTLADVMNMLENYWMHNWMIHLCEGLKRTSESIHMENLNHKLEQISMTDEMTGLYNRLGYEKCAIPQLDSCREIGKTGAIMVVDINSMKVINDKYGHLQGDIAIRVVAQTIKENLPDSWSGVRYGGDEFVLLGECLVKKRVEILKRKLMECLESKVSQLMLQFPLTVSIGSVLVNPNENISLEEYFRMADNAMYMMKQKIHNKESK